MLTLLSPHTTGSGPPSFVAVAEEPRAAARGPPLLAADISKRRGQASFS